MKKGSTRVTRIAVRTAVTLLFAAFCGQASGQASAEHVYQIPEQLADGWKVSSLNDARMNEALIAKLTDQIAREKYRGIHSLLIVKDGALVHEVYFKDFDRESLHPVHSITKSVTSTLVGIAIEKGFFAGVNEPLHEWFPQYRRAFHDPRKREITLKHVLTLTSGLQWTEWNCPYSDPMNSHYQMVHCDDWVKYAIERPVEREPGTQWAYNTGSVHALSAALHEATGIYAGEFAETHLFEPLGITRYEWNTDPLGYQCTGGTWGGLRMRARDVAKFGYLFLNEGLWEGVQVVPAEWVEEATKEYAITANGRGFGYLWWKGKMVIRGREIDHFYAAGYGGQSIHIVPELDLMIVILCWTNAEDADIFAPTIMVYNAAMQH